MKERLRKSGIAALFTLSLVAVTVLLRIPVAGEAIDPGLAAALQNLYYVPVLAAAMLLGETAGTLIALLALVASTIAWNGLAWPKDLTAWWILGIHGAFFITLAFLAARIAERMRANTREWQSLHEISHTINASLDLDETLRVVTEQSVALTSADACAIRLINGNDTLTYAKTYGLSEQYLAKAPLMAHDNPLLERMLCGEPVVIHDIRKDRSILYRDEMQTEGIVSVLTLPLRIGDNVIGLLNLYRKRFVGFSRRDRRLASAFAEQVSIAIQNARLYASIRDNYLDTVRALTRAIEAKDPMTLGHSERVTEFALRIARHLGLSSAELETLEFGSMLHDIGKIGLDDQMLAKTGHLSLDQQMLMEMHPMIGKSIIEPVEFLRLCVPIVLYHHERWDGTGYPEGLSGIEIPLLARIVAVADALEHRMHPAATAPIPLEEALQMVREEAGTRFAPPIVDVLATVMQQNRPVSDSDEVEKLATSEA